MCVPFHLFLPHCAHRGSSNKKIAVNCSFFFPTSVAFRPCVPRGNAAERDQERDSQRALHCADRCACSHPGLPVLHRWLHFLQGRLHPRGGPSPQCNYEWGWISVAFPPKRQRWIIKKKKNLNKTNCLPFYCVLEGGGSLASVFVPTGMCQGGIDQNCTTTAQLEGNRYCAVGLLWKCISRKVKVTPFHHDNRSKELWPALILWLFWC